MLVLSLLIWTAGATVFNVTTAMSSAAITSVVQSLQPGDTVVFGPGVYTLNFVLVHVSFLPFSRFIIRCRPRTGLRRVQSCLAPQEAR